MDNKFIYIDKLTPSAKIALKETADEISSKILERALEIAQSRNTSEMEISLRDIIEAKEQLLDFKVQQEKSDYKRKRLSLMISLSGAIYALAGIILFMYQSNNFDLKSDLGLIVTSIGILTMLLGFIYTQLIYKKTSNIRTIIDREYSIENKTDYDVVQRWQVIEKLTSDIMKENGFTENKARSVNSIIDFLSTHLSDVNSVNKLRHLLMTRNKILHEFYQPSRAEKTELINFSNSIIKTLEDMRK